MSQTSKTVKCLIILLFSTIRADNFDQPVDFLSDDRISYVNAKKSFWTAQRNFPETTTKKQLQKLIGSNSSYYFRASKTKYYLQHKTLEHQPWHLKRFDARKQWAYCAEIIGTIHDQGFCDNSWVLAPISVMSDRLCIETKGKQKVLLSAEDVIGCCSDCKPTKTPCSGGYTSKVWNFWLHNKIVTGTYPTSTSSFQGCQLFNGTSSTCTNKCTNPNYKNSYDQDKKGGSLKYRIETDEAQIQLEILKHGPVTAQVEIYEDFFIYKEGIYIKLEGDLVGYHVVKIIGWGEEDGVRYWLCTNSWGKKWGNLGGIFKIRKGVNECKVESDIITGTALPRFFTREMPINGSFADSSAELVRSHEVFLGCIVFLFLVILGTC